MRIPALPLFDLLTGGNQHIIFQGERIGVVAVRRPCANKGDVIDHSVSIRHRYLYRLLGSKRGDNAMPGILLFVCTAGVIQVDGFILACSSGVKPLPGYGHTRKILGQYVLSRKLRGQLHAFVHKGVFACKGECSVTADRHLLRGLQQIAQAVVLTSRLSLVGTDTRVFDRVTRLVGGSGLNEQLRTRTRHRRFPLARTAAGRSGVQCIVHRSG